MDTGNDFSFVSPSINDLPAGIKDQLTEIVFSWRDGVESVCAVTENMPCLCSLLGHDVPSEVSGAITRRYGVDLESIGTDTLRLYVDGSDEGVSLVSFKYSSDLKLTEKKLYKKATQGVLIDRYDASGQLISGDESEFPVSKSEFLGSAELADRMEQVANDKGYAIKFLKKGNANQSYARVYKGRYFRELEGS